MSAASGERWFVVRRPLPAPRVRLYAFPYAGGGALAFGALGERLGPDVEVAAVRLPGRESRIAEPPLGDLDELVARLAAALAPRLDGTPVAFLGYSVGALVAFELARALRAQGAQQPAALIAAACPAPRRHPLFPDLHRLPDGELRAELARLGGTPPAVLANDELLGLMLPALRADFRLAGEYRHRPEPPLACRLTVLRGEGDEYTGPADEALWAAEVEPGAASAAVVPGGHFFVHEEPGRVVAAVSAALRGDATATC